MSTEYNDFIKRISADIERKRAEIAQKRSDAATLSKRAGTLIHTSAPRAKILEEKASDLQQQANLDERALIATDEYPAYMTYLERLFDEDEINNQQVRENSDSTSTVSYTNVTVAARVLQTRVQQSTSSSANAGLPPGVVGVKSTPAPRAIVAQHVVREDSTERLIKLTEESLTADKKAELTRFAAEKAIKEAKLAAEEAKLAAHKLRLVKDEEERKSRVKTEQVRIASERFALESDEAEARKEVFIPEEQRRAQLDQAHIDGQTRLRTTERLTLESDEAEVRQSEITMPEAERRAQLELAKREELKRLETAALDREADKRAQQVKAKSKRDSKQAVKAAAQRKKEQESARRTAEEARLEAQKQEENEKHIVMVMQDEESSLITLLQKNMAEGISTQVLPDRIIAFLISTLDNKAKLISQTFDNNPKLFKIVAQFSQNNSIFIRKLISMIGPADAHKAFNVIWPIFQELLNHDITHPDISAKQNSSKNLFLRFSYYCDYMILLSGNQHLSLEQKNKISTLFLMFYNVVMNGRFFQSIEREMSDVSRKMEFIRMNTQLRQHFNSTYVNTVINAFKLCNTNVCNAEYLTALNIFVLNMDKSIACGLEFMNLDPGSGSGCADGAADKIAQSASLTADRIKEKLHAISSINKSIALYKRGRSLLRGAKYHDANIVFDQALAFSGLPAGMRAEALSSKGDCYRMQDDHENAVTNYNLALANQHFSLEGKAYAYILKGFSHNKLDQHDLALTAISDSIATGIFIDDQTKVSALKYKGNSLMKMKKYVEAITAYEQALAINPNLLGKDKVLSDKSICQRELERQAISSTFDTSIGTGPAAAGGASGRTGVIVTSDDCLVMLAEAVLSISTSSQACSAIALRRVVTFLHTSPGQAYLKYSSDGSRPVSVVIDIDTADKVIEGRLSV